MVKMRCHQSSADSRDKRMAGAGAATSHQGGEDRGVFLGTPGLEAQSSAGEESRWWEEPLKSVVPG